MGTQPILFLNYLLTKQFYFPALLYYSITFFDRYTLRVHTQEVHLNHYEFVCDACGIKFSQAHKLKKHKKLVHEEGRETMESKRQKQKNNTSIEYFKNLQEVKCDLCDNNFLGKISNA